MTNSRTAIQMLRKQLSDYETVIKMIAYSEFCKYDPMTNSSYAIGVVDGHRYCAKLCRDILELHGIGGTLK